MNVARAREDIQAAWKRYLVILSGLGVVILVLTIVLWPWLYSLAVEHFELPQFERQFGFRGARLSIPGEPASEVYGIAEVVPGGILEQSGVRPGDVPIAHHGGLWDFFGALQEAQSGQPSEFTVVALAEWRHSRQARRIKLPALGTAPSSERAGGPTTR
jgi:hypothetical protein